MNNRARRFLAQSHIFKEGLSITGMHSVPDSVIPEAWRCDRS